jgi:hypothetical protein
MRFFSSIFGWFKDFFGMVASTVIGEAAESISETAMAIVEGLETKEDLSGAEKWDYARKELESRYPSIESAAINLAIESALAIVRDKMK